MGWDYLQSRQRLAGQLRRLALFADCGHQELSYLAKWADVVAVPAGQELVREGSGGFWMFVLLDGRVHLTSRGETVGSLEAGDEIGHESLVGFRPHPFTATAETASILLVLRPRFGLSLLTMGGGIQRHLYPTLPPDGFGAHFEQMLEKGRREWSDLQATADRAAHPSRSTSGSRSSTAVLSRPAPAYVAPAASPPLADQLLSSERLAGRRLSLAEAAAVVARIPVAASAEAGAAPAQRIGPPWLSRVAIRVLLALAVFVSALVLGLYHPPRYAITAGRPIDVIGDISISGAPVHPVGGHLLLLWVQARQPNLAGLVWDALTGVTTVGIDPASKSTSAQTDAYDSGRRQYLDSQRIAVGLAEAAAGVDPRRVRVRIADRGFVGPSGGLVYSLAVYDLLTGAGPRAGQVVAATGALSPDGSIAAVGWVSVKAAAASSGHAGVFLVPMAESGLVGHRGLRVEPVSTFRLALVRQGPE